MPITTAKVRPVTQLKLAAIAKARRWTRIETIDAIADEFIANHDIAVDVAPEPTSQAQQNNADGSSVREPSIQPRRSNGVSQPRRKRGISAKSA